MQTFTFDTTHSQAGLGDGSALPIPPDWRRWIAENKMLRIPDETLFAVLAANGFGHDQVAAELAAVDLDPCFRAGDRIAQRLRKMESLVHIWHQLSSLSSRAGTVDRRSNLSPQEFLNCYYSANRPVVLTDLITEWKALTEWSPAYLKAVCGGEIVEIMMDRERDARYEINSLSHKRAIPFADYIDMVERAGATNDFYLVANNHFLARESAQALLQDLMPLPVYLDPERLAGAYFWFGPGGTVTPLHHDTMNVLLTQIRGRKRIALIAPEQTPWMYNELGVYSEVDYERPDFESYPLFQNVQITEVMLEPGEALFLPVGWWHHVRALDVSMSVSFTNFTCPNEYEWSNSVVQG